MTGSPQNIQKVIGDAARDAARDSAAELAQELATALGAAPEVRPAPDGADLVLPSKDAAKAFGLMLAARSLRRMAGSISASIARALRGPSS